jgi:hypothetical protein
MPGVTVVIAAWLGLWPTQASDVVFVRSETDACLEEARPT